MNIPCLVKKHLLLCIILTSFFSFPVYSQVIINASDFGVKSNSTQDMAIPVQNAIAACKTKKNAILVLPGGLINIWPKEAAKRELYISNSTEDDTSSKWKNIAFLFEDCKNITLDGNNSLIVLHGKMISFAALKSSNIKIKNIRFDYARPTMSELSIKTVTANRIETEIHPDSKYTIDSGHIQFYGDGWIAKAHHTILYKPTSQTLHYSSLKPLLESRALQTGPNHVQFEGNFQNSKFVPGDILTFRDPYRDNCGAFFHRSKNIYLENINMHFMHGLGIVSQFCENISLFKVSVAPPENSGRIISSFADCFHFSGCKGLIKIDSCFTSGSHDDPVNIHGTHLKITGIDTAKKIKVRFMHHQTYGFEAFFAGDSIAFIDPQTLLPIAKAKLKKARLLNPREMELETATPLPSNITTGLSIENITWTPEVIIKNSRFERTNTRGLLITTRRKVLIENNSFYHTGMYPILIANDASSWYESGAVNNITIRNNRFIECGYNNGSGGIAILPENHQLSTAVHRNIYILNNQFITSYTEVLTARSVHNLVFNGNKISYTEKHKTEPSKSCINLNGCTNVKIEKNSFVESEAPLVKITNMKQSELTTDLKVQNH